MNQSLDRLYDLLPVIHRLRDGEQGDMPLRALLQLIAESVNGVEDEITQMYENWFIETSQDWAVPYIGDLVGYSPVPAAGAPAVSAERARVLIPRREVANTIRYRRRKGSISLLESLANDVAGWPARAVEFYRLLAATRSRLAGQPPGVLADTLRAALPDLRQGEALDRLSGPFTAFAHTVDVRRAGADPSGKYNIPSVGVFVWRLRAYPVTRTAAYCLDEVGPHCYTFSILGNNSPLFTKPEKEVDPVGIAQPRHVPEPIRRRAFEERGVVDGVERGLASGEYYGEGKSLVVYATDWPVKGAPQPVPAQLIVPADLTDWVYRPRKNSLALDPVLGRIAFPPGQLPKKGVTVSYHYGFAADLGGGEYPRPLQRPPQPGGSPEAQVYRIQAEGGAGTYSTLNAALDAWQKDNPLEAVIEFCESGVFTERFGLQDPKGPAGRRIPIELKRGQNLELRAASGARPVLRLLDYQAESPDSFSFLVAPGSGLTLDGLLITGRPVHIEGYLPPAPPVEPPPQDDDKQPAPPAAANPAGANPAGGWDVPASVRIRHCTLVPGWTLNENCEPKRPAEPSLELYNLQARVEIERTILGSIQVYQDEVLADPIPLVLKDSILDATGSTCDEPECEALGAPGSAFAHVFFTVLRSTVFGRVLAHAVELGEDSIFNGLVRVARRQRGCLRFCYVMPGSRTPRRFNCQPDLVEEPVRAAYPTGPERETALLIEQERVQPLFRSVRYGTPDYARLSDVCAIEIRRGAEDEGEMGVYHHLYNPLREANLNVRLAEYTPAGTDVGIFMVT